jgi:5-(carboxyamino)imidazole ribonucleotide synthase
MLAVAGLRLGIEVRFLTSASSGATEGIGTTIIAPANDWEALSRFVSGCSVITIENEWAPLDEVAAFAAERGLDCHPSPAALASIADKLLQKQRLQRAGLELGRFRACDDLAAAERVAAEWGYPLVLKRRRGAYDGYGNRTVHAPEQLGEAWAALAGPEQLGLLVEAHVPFVRELAVMVARRADGQAVVYPVAHTVQEDHCCAAVVVPAPIDEHVRVRAEALARAAVEAFEIVGVCAVELFELADGRLLVNELAPRPHNSGHFSIEACISSQFDNHLRAILGFPLGDPSLRVPAAVMLNLLGPAQVTRAAPDIRGALAIPGVEVHLYGKRDLRSGRKLGHVTVTGDDPTVLRARAAEAVAAIQW